MGNIFYVYFYLREDGTPYYVGKGKDNRATKHFKGEIRPPKDKLRIVFPDLNLDEFDAFRMEKFWIGFYGRKDLGTGILRNKTDGGEGPSGRIDSEETRSKKSAAMKNRPKSLSSRIKMSEAKIGKKQSKEHVAKRIAAVTGQTRSEETKQKIAEANFGRKASEETRKKISASKKWLWAGENNPSKRPEMRAILCAPKPKSKCLYCDKLCAAHMLSRYHNDNCKNKFNH